MSAVREYLDGETVNKNNLINLKSRFELELDFLSRDFGFRQTASLPSSAQQPQCQFIFQGKLASRNLM
jgi:hypothetical protein